MERQRCATTFHFVPFGFDSFLFVVLGDVHRRKRGELV
ncbi:MAG: hypothetical protein ETSY2_54510 [Candidatus Entotheonella gemina]|uniref:Uncharacterized protein n=1 Tax=Candidatus Entotheonella gemina TaxID=1429439 RepID=W4L441_9BACT|nr:MAG: hypothetical protein ETSY2_54510 [Candidatus Entotheonella gemina]